MEKKPCVRCERLIDPFARICPFCNWDQELSSPKEDPVAASAAAQEEIVGAATEERRRRRKRILTAVGIAALLLATFAIGSFIARLGRKPQTPQEDVPSTVRTPTRSSTQLTDLRLVPVDLTSTVGGSITSAPPSGTPAGAAPNDHSDATALPSAQYSELVKRSAQRQVAGNGGADTLDPRTIVGPPIPQIRRAAPRPAPAAPRGEQGSDPVEREGGGRTLPEPISQPIPDIDANGTAKFRLRIGVDGSVMEVDVLQSIPGATPRLIAAIQRWKFKPATENGRPVEGIHLVDISFKGKND